MENKNSVTGKVSFIVGVTTFVLLLFCSIMVVASILADTEGSAYEISSWDDFINRANARQFEDNRVTLEVSKIIAIISEGSTTPAVSLDIPAGTTVFFKYGDLSREWYLAQLKEAGIDYELGYDSGIFRRIVLSWAPLSFVLVIFLSLITMLLGILGIFKKDCKKALPIAGTSIGCINILLVLLIIMLSVSAAFIFTKQSFT
jgi:hypothetical protein